MKKKIIQDLPPFKNNQEIKFGPYENQKKSIDLYLRSLHQFGDNDIKVILNNLRIDCFIGENGSGKSTLLKEIKKTENNCLYETFSIFDYNENISEHEKKLFTFLINNDYNKLKNEFVKNFLKTEISNFSCSIKSHNDVKYNGTTYGKFKVTKAELTEIISSYNNSLEVDTRYSIFGMKLNVLIFSYFFNKYLYVDQYKSPGFYGRLMEDYQILNFFIENIRWQYFGEREKQYTFMKKQLNLLKNRNYDFEGNGIVDFFKDLYDFFQFTGHSVFELFKNDVSVIFDNKEGIKLSFLEEEKLEESFIRSYGPSDCGGITYNLHNISNTDKLNLFELLSYFSKIDNIKFLDQYNKPIGKQYTNLSSGEKNILLSFGKLFSELLMKSNNENKNFIILIDEPDLYIHLSWQKKYIQELINFFSVIVKEKGISLHIVIATHSPFILSDFFNENIFEIKKDSSDGFSISKSNFNYFGANYIDIINNGFFFNNRESLMGSFSESSINIISKKLKYLSILSSYNLTVDDFKDKKLNSDKKKKIDTINFLLEEIGENVIQKKDVENNDLFYAQKIEKLFNSYNSLKNLIGDEFLRENLFYL